MVNVAERLDKALRAAGLAIDGVRTLGTWDVTDRALWRVDPPSVQSAAQPIIDAFEPDDPVHAQAEADTTAAVIAASPLALALLDVMAETFETLPTEIQRDVPTVEALRVTLTDRLRVRAAQQE